MVKPSFHAVRILCSLAIAHGALVTTAEGIIVAGANGGSDTTNNTTRSALESATSTSFPIYDNVVRYSDSSGIYLGYDPSTHDVWVLTANHVNDSNAAITIDGLSYTHQQRIVSATFGDLELNRYRRADLQVPGLPAVSLASSSPTVGSAVAMIGFGVNRSETAANDPNSGDDTLLSNGQRGYEWGSTSLKRWGLNEVDLYPNESGVLSTLPSLSNTTVFFMGFDRPDSGEWLTSNEGIGSVGDSGGGVFYFDGTQWVLTGIFSSATRGDLDNSGTITGADRFSNFNGIGGSFGGTFATDIATYRDEILGYTGVLIPEPSSSALLLLFVGAALVRRNR